MRIWRRVDNYHEYRLIAEVDEAGNLRQWCEDEVIGWNIWRTSVQSMGWKDVHQYLKERGRRFKEVTA